MKKKRKWLIKFLIYILQAVNKKHDGGCSAPCDPYSLRASPTSSIFIILNLQRSLRDSRPPTHSAARCSRSSGASGGRTFGGWSRRDLPPTTWRNTDSHLRRSREEEEGEQWAERERERQSAVSVMDGNKGSETPSRAD